jgi:cyclase
MLKRRIIPIQLLMDGRLVKTTRFGTWRDVGDPVASARVYNSQYADELIFLNINRGQRDIQPLVELIERVSEVCFMPLSLGGGIQTQRDAETLIENGADKVVLNSVNFQSTEIATHIAKKYGSQAVVVSMDAKAHEGHWHLFSNCGRQKEDVSLDTHIKRMLDAGAGEFFVNAMDQDGVMEGYDLKLIQYVVERSSVPVIGCGGAGTFEHMKEAFKKTGAQAMAAGSLFNFGDNNPIRAKAFLSNHGIPFKKV